MNTLEQAFQIIEKIDIDALIKRMVEMELLEVQDKPVDNHIDELFNSLKEFVSAKEDNPTIPKNHLFETMLAHIKFVSTDGSMLIMVTSSKPIAYETLYASILGYAVNFFQTHEASTPFEPIDMKMYHRLFNHNWCLKCGAMIESPVESISAECLKSHCAECKNDVVFPTGLSWLALVASDRNTIAFLPYEPVLPSSTSTLKVKSKLASMNNFMEQVSPTGDESKTKVFHDTHPISVKVYHHLFHQNWCLKCGGTTKVVSTDCKNVMMSKCQDCQMVFSIGTDPEWYDNLTNGLNCIMVLPYVPVLPTFKHIAAMQKKLEENLPWRSWTPLPLDADYRED